MAVSTHGKYIPHSNKLWLKLDTVQYICCSHRSTAALDMNQLLSCTLTVIVILGFAALPIMEKQHVFQPGKASNAETAKCLVEKGKAALTELQREPGFGHFVMTAGHAEGISCWPCSIDLQLRSMRDKVRSDAHGLPLCNHTILHARLSYMHDRSLHACAILQDGNHYCSSCCQTVDACPVKLSSKEDLNTCSAAVDWMSAHYDHPTVLSMLDFFKAS